MLDRKIQTLQNLAPASPIYQPFSFCISFRGHKLCPRDTSCVPETLDFVSRTLEDVLRRRSTESGGPPPLDLTCAHAIDVS